VNYLFHPSSEAEYLETIAYFESKRPGLGALYFAEFEQTIENACTSPQRYPVKIQPDLRCIQMKKFPFTILFRELSNSIFNKIFNRREKEEEEKG